MFDTICWIITFTFAKHLTFQSGGIKRLPRIQSVYVRRHFFFGDEGLSLIFVIYSYYPHAFIDKFDEFSFYGKVLRVETMFPKRKIHFIVNFTMRWWCFFMLLVKAPIEKTLNTMINLRTRYVRAFLCLHIS